MSPNVIDPVARRQMTAVALAALARRTSDLRELEAGIINTPAAPYQPNSLGTVDNTVLETSVGRMCVGLTNTEGADVIVLPPTPQERPLGAGSYSDIAATAFKNTFMRYQRSGQKTVIVGGQEELDEFVSTMVDEMITPRDKALDTAGFTLSTEKLSQHLSGQKPLPKDEFLEEARASLGFFFQFMPMKDGIAYVGEAGAGIRIAAVDDTSEAPPYDYTLLIQDEGKDSLTKAGVRYKSLGESLATVDALIKKQGEAGGFYTPEKNQPSVHVIGSAKLLSQEDNTCKVYHDGRGNAMLLDMGVPVKTLIENGEDPGRINTILLTHPHADHTSGVADLLAYKAMRGEKATAVVLNEEMRHSLENMFSATLGQDEYQRLKDKVSFQVLEKDREGSLSYTPLKVSGTTIEAIDVRHVTERAIGYTLTTDAADGVRVQYSHSGDMQYGVGHIDKLVAKLSSSVEYVNSHEGFPPEGTSESELLSTTIVSLSGIEYSDRKGAWTNHTSVNDDTKYPELQSLLNGVDLGEFEDKKAQLERWDHQVVSFLSPRQNVSSAVVSIDVGESIIHASPQNASAIKSEILVDMVGGTSLSVYGDHCDSKTESTVDGTLTQGDVIVLARGEKTKWKPTGAETALAV